MLVASVNMRHGAILQKTEGELEQLRSKISAIETRQAELKKVLYGRFGKSINLGD